MLAVRPLLSVLSCRPQPACSLHANKNGASYIFSFIILTRLMLLGDGVGTVKPISGLLVAEVNIVGVEVESDHISPSFQCPPC